jgi:multisubunit Na+/H+ antiporter MnhF subunit
MEHVVILCPAIGTMMCLVVHLGLTNDTNTDHKEESKDTKDVKEKTVTRVSDSLLVILPLMWMASFLMPSVGMVSSLGAAFAWCASRKAFGQRDKTRLRVFDMYLVNALMLVCSLGCLYRIASLLEIYNRDKQFDSAVVY